MTDTNKRYNASEQQIINNVIGKIKIYMLKNNQTLFAMAQTLGFSYQPFYRLSKGQNLPSLTTLTTIASFLDCTVPELVSSQCFFNVNLITHTDMLPEIKDQRQIRVYLKLEEYLAIINDTFFCLQASDCFVNMYQSIDSIVADGQFLIKYNNKVQKMNVTSSSSKFIVVENNGQEEKIVLEHIVPIGKFYKRIFISPLDDSILLGSNEIFKDWETV